MTDSPPPLPRTPAGFGVRLLAHLIDSAIWTFLMMLVVMGLFGGEILAAAKKAVEEAAGTIDAAAEQAVDTAKALTQPPPEIEEPLPPAKPASWVDLLKPLK